MDYKAAVSKFKMSLKANSLIRGPYLSLKRRKDVSRLQNNLKGACFFDNRSASQNALCVVLAGYKPYLYPYIFPRLYRYLPKGIDVCVVTAGKYVKALHELCGDFGWSYLSTENNNVSLAQNKAIELHPEADLLFKLDEDIFVTEGFFEEMLAARARAIDGVYNPGVIVPILPVNGFGHVWLLRRFDVLEQYVKQFEEPKICANPQAAIECSAEAAQFMWGDGGWIPQLDALAALLHKEPKVEEPCAIRFSIGAMLMGRDVWEQMGYFEVMHGFVGLGLDERQLCSWCAVNSRPIMVSTNAVAGHFGFGSQTEAMKEYLPRHQVLFEMADSPWGLAR